VSRRCAEAQGSVLTEQNAEGYRQAVYGLRVVDRVEQLAIDRAKALSPPSTPRPSALQAKLACT